MSDIDPFKLFLDIQLKLPRNGPGSARATAEAFGLVPELPAKPEILDIGCGQGPEAFDLLKLTDGRITAVDLFEPFLDKLHERAVKEEVPEERLTVKRADMEDLPFGDGEFDLIWSEGAVYLMGFEDGLKAWRRHLKPTGACVVSELTWLTDKPTPEVWDYWREMYPGMGTVETNTEAAKRAGYRVVATTVLPKEDWFTDYYAPMKQEIRKSWDEYKGVEEAEAVFNEMYREIDIADRFLGEFSYVFYVMTRAE